MSDTAISKTTLGSGLRVVTESLPQLHSVTIGAWVGTGSRDEPEALAGASHFLEHLLFKGTDSRTAREIAEAIEGVGGEMNAFTAHEQTVFYVRVPDAHLQLALDVLCDVVWRPAFRPDEVESERQVILEELAQRDDTPDDLVHDVFARAMYPNHPLGREVLGTVASIESMPRDDIAAYHRAHYHPSNTVLAAAGNLQHDDVVALLDRFAADGSGTRPMAQRHEFAPAAATSVVERDTEQAHVIIGSRALAHDDPDRYALTVLNHAFGGGMASRLFQAVREDRGLAYSVYSYRAAFDDTGYLAIYAGTTTERVHETLGVVRAETARLVEEGTLSARELEAAKGHLKGSLAMSLETSSARMRRLGRGELIDGEIPSLDELAARVDAVSADDVARAIDRVLREHDPILAVVGPFSQSDF